jgi:hypothetical protein
MVQRQNRNLEILELTVARLGPLMDQMVFLGGCVTGLLLTDPAAPAIRPTEDVDVITELGSLGDYYRLAERLRERGFREDQSEEAPMCRWIADGVVLDVMPTEAQILGFGNEWYRLALATAVEIVLPSGARIRSVTAPCFLATKLAAFEDRGEGDYVMSRDMEDIVAVLDGRPGIAGEVAECDPALRRHLAGRLAALLGDQRFLEALPGHLPGDAANQARVPLIRDRMTAMAR